MKTLKIFLGFFLCLVVIFLISLVFLPMLASTPTGKNLFLGAVNYWIPGKLHVKSVDLSWNRPSYFEEIELFDAGGDSLVHIGQASIHNPLWKLLTSSNPEPLLDLHRVSAKIISDEQGVTNIERALSFRASKRSLSRPLEPIILENFEVSSEFLSQLKRIKILAHGTTRQGILQGSFKLDGDLGNDIYLSLKATKFPVLLLDQFLQLKIPESAGLLQKLLGEELNLDLTVDKSRVEQEIQTPEFHSHLSGKVEEGLFTLTKPMDIDLFVTPEAFTLLKRAFKQENFPDLKIPVKLQLQAKSLSLPIHQPTHLQGNFDLLLSGLRLAEFDMDSVQLTADVHSSEPQLHIVTSFEGMRKNEPFLGSVKWTIQNLPYTLNLISLLEQKNDFQVLLNDQSEKANLAVMGELNHEELSLTGDFVMPKLYAENFKLKSTGIPWEDLEKKHFQSIKLQGSFSADKIGHGNHFTKVVQAPWSYDGRLDEGRVNFSLMVLELMLKGDLRIKNKGQAIDFSLDQIQGKGKLNLAGRIVRPMKEDMSAEVKGDLDQFPTQVLMELLPMPEEYSHKVYALFGEKVDGKIMTKIEKMQGPVAFVLKGERCDLNFDGLIQNGILMLNRPLTVDITVSKEVSDHFLDDLVPLLNSATHAETPIRLTLSERGFQFPLNHPNLGNVTLPWASLDLGKIYFTREGKLAQVISLLNIKPSDSFSVWFTPLYFSFKEGVLTLSRFDMLLADLYPIATWGWINFPKEAVHMEVGLTGRALTHSFGHLPLPKNYMLTIPLRGTPNNPRLDTAKVAAKLSSLAAMSTGPQGTLVSALIQLASGSLSQKIPDPTMNPLPWDTDPDEVTEASEEFPNPVKEFQKGAEKLFKNIFR